MVVVALASLIVGLVFGFFIGRSVDDGPASTATASATTAPTTTERTGDTIPQDPPTSAGAPPSTDLEPNVIGTVDDPIPFGQPYVIGVYELTVVGTDRDALDRLLDHDGFNPRPDADERRMLVEIELRYLDANGAADTAYLALDVSDGTSTWTDLDAGCGRVPDSLLEGVFLGPGDAVTGNACFTVPVEVVDDLYLAIEGFAGPVYFALE